MFHLHKIICLVLVNVPDCFNYCRNVFTIITILYSNIVNIFPILGMCQETNFL